MKDFLVVVLVIAVITFLIYLPVIKAQLRIRRVSRMLCQQVSSLNNLYDMCVMNTFTTMLGLGGSKNSSCTFEVAHKNKEIAMSAIYDLDFFEV